MKPPKVDFDYDDELATALTSSLSSSHRKLPKLLGGQVDDIRSFLDSLATFNDLRDCYFRDIMPALLPQRVCLTAGYTGSNWCSCLRLRFGGLSTCYGIRHRRELDGISVEKSLCPIARSVAPATDLADMAQCVGSLFDPLCASSLPSLDQSIFWSLAVMFVAHGRLLHQLSFYLYQVYFWMWYHPTSSGMRSRLNSSSTTS